MRVCVCVSAFVCVCAGKVANETDTRHLQNTSHGGALAGMFPLGGTPKTPGLGVESHTHEQRTHGDVSSNSTVRDMKAAELEHTQAPTQVKTNVFNSITPDIFAVGPPQSHTQTHTGVADPPPSAVKSEFPKSGKLSSQRSVTWDIEDPG